MQQIDQIDHALAERRASNACLSCGNKPLETSDYLHGLPVQATGEITTSAVRICDHCGHVHHYSLARLGLDSMT
jgi:hypothetical protein